jgi:putative SOS response-associated peptidase YedK
MNRVWSFRSCFKENANKMCGRYALTATPEELQALMEYLEAEDFPPRYNIAPTQPIAIVRFDHGACHFALVRWGLVPSWVKDPKAFSLLINARSETAAEKPSFRAAMRYRRCLVPASGFYEWRRGPGKAKQPFWIRPKGGGLVAFAGLWETWSDSGGSEIDSGCILTTAANETIAPIHARMPVVIPPADFARWLEANDNPPGAVADLLRPAPNDLFEAIPVGPRVNTARNDDVALQEPVADRSGEGA